tara:strand:+ start:131 stop:913 length:783 start_codon:yes stop_codon:yes gene_type:complete
MEYSKKTPAGDEPAPEKQNPDRTSEQQTLDEWGIGIGPPEDSGGSSGWYTDDDVEAHHDAMFALNLARAWAHRKIFEKLESPPTLTSLMTKVNPPQDPALIHMLPPDALIQKAISLISQASGIDPAVVDMMFVVDMIPSVNPDVFKITPEDLTNIDIPTAASLMGEKGYLDSNFVSVLVNRSIPISDPNRLEVGDIVVRAPANSSAWPKKIEKAVISIIGSDGEALIEDPDTGIIAWVPISQAVKLYSSREKDAEDGGDR